MGRFLDLKPAATWQRFESAPSDWSAADSAELKRMTLRMMLIREFEETMVGLWLEGLVHGPVHTSIGQEGGAVGCIYDFRPGDMISGSHRAHHHFLARALDHIEVDRTLDADAVNIVERTAAEVMGLRTGWTGGRGGSIHLAWPEGGILGSNAIVGGGVPFATGVAWAQKRAGRGEVSMTFFGDGAMHIGSTLEAMNLAALYRLPICFVVENNRYAVATTVAESTHEQRLSSRGVALGIPAYEVDGMDPVAVRLVAGKIVEDMRAGGGPAILEVQVYRYLHQNGNMPGSAFKYRTRQEEAEWRARCPIARTVSALVQSGAATAQEIADMEGMVKAAMTGIAGRLTQQDGNKRIVAPSLWPDPETADDGIRGDLSELSGRRMLEAADYDGATQSMKFIDVIAAAQMRAMDADDRIITLGEDIHRLGGGTNGATKGLYDRFPDRVIPTPITEAGFVGMAGGIAMDGRFRPVVELMYPDFCWVAADQLFNQVAKARHMFGVGQMPIVIRGKVALGTGYGSQHSLDPAGIYATSPGFRILAPSTPHDYIGLLNSALLCDDPVYIIEHVDLYKMLGDVPDQDWDFTIPIGKARTVREGTEMTILSYLWSVHDCVKAVEEMGVDAEIIDLRTLDKAGFDWPAVQASIAKTNNVLLAEQGPGCTSYFGWVADELQRRCFDDLDQPVMRVHGRETAPANSLILERATIASVPEIKEAIQHVMRAKGRPVAA
jgi:2-oxoisovalerate dehydrogenase E1 component